MSVYVYTDVYVSVMMIQAEVPSMNDWIVRLQSKKQQITLSQARQSKINFDETSKVCPAKGNSIFSNGHATLLLALSVRR